MDKLQSDIDKIVGFNKNRKPYYSLTFIQKKERLFETIRYELSATCDVCTYMYLNEWMSNAACSQCPIADDFKTAILSLDKKENWPDVFK